MAERTGVQALFEKQEAERKEFVQEQVKLLNEAGFNWKLPRAFKKETGYEGKGLITNEHPWYSEVLTPDKGLIYVQSQGPIRPVSLLGGGMTGSGISHLQYLEGAVNKTISELSKSKPTLRRLGAFFQQT